MRAGWTGNSASLRLLLARADHVYKAIKDGDLVARKHGRRTIILPKDLQKFVEALPVVTVAKHKHATHRGGK